MSGASLALLAAVAVAVRVGLASRWPTIADEAYYRQWAKHLDFGYYDQPPAIAWALALVDGGASLAARWPGIAGALIWVGVARSLKDPVAALSFGFGAPILWFLGFFSTPDALLLPAWAAATAAAGRGRWVQAGVWSGVAAMSKHTGLALAPLLWFSVGPAGWRRAGPWWCLAVSAAMVAPNLAWNLSHEWVTLRFQAAEALWHPATRPGVGALPGWCVEQALVVSPVLFAAGVRWMWTEARAVQHAWSSGGSAGGAAWFAAVPMLAVAAVASMTAPAEAHWAAPAWAAVAVGVGISGGAHGERAARGAGVGLVCTLLVIAQVDPGLMPAPAQPTARVFEGPVLADRVSVWAAPAPGERGLPVLTERYQEMALLREHAGLAAETAPGCGRVDQTDLWRTDQALPAEFWFVRPARGGDGTCLGDRVELVHRERLDGTLDDGRWVGTWDLFRLRAAPTASGASVERFSR